ncbi:MAG: putative ABC transport system ATP-binding [Planctomycetota bacterium]|nr:MAG: putative ABC transport system ATP-binding [Planctomycetota bacterium]
MSLELRHVFFDAPTRSLRDLSLAVAAGEICVVLGPNGSGKSTVLRLCIGLVEPLRGEVRLCGEALTGSRGAAREALRRQVGYVFQEGALLEGLTARENVALPLAYGGRLGAADRRARVEECLRLVGMEGAAERYASALSLGERKRVSMARAIAGRPRLLLLDDPTAGLDSLQSAETVALIRTIRRETGAAFLIVSNDATRFLRWANRVAILHGGAFTSVGEPHEVMNSSDPWLTEVFDKLARAESREEGIA